MGGSGAVAERDRRGLTPFVSEESLEDVDRHVGLDELISDAAGGIAVGTDGQVRGSAP